MSAEKSKQEEQSNKLYTLLAKVRSLCIVGSKEDGKEIAKQVNTEGFRNAKYFQGRQDVWDEIIKIIPEHFS